MSSILSTEILTVAVGGVWGRGLTGQHLAAAQQLVLNHRPLLVHDASQNSSVVLENRNIIYFSFCVRCERKGSSPEIWDSLIIGVALSGWGVREVRVQLIIIENRFCGERRRERVMWDVMREGLSEVVISLPIFAHLLLPDDVLVPADGAEPQQVGLLLGHPVAELPEADQQGAPVLSSVL